MIRGFEEQTHELTGFECQAEPIIASWLAEAKANNPITNIELRKRLKRDGLNITDARIRKIINHIRTTGMVPCLVANSKGYYVSKDQAEIKDYIESLKERARSIFVVANSLSEQLRDIQNQAEGRLF